jgi:hypothetical protein
MATTLPIVTSDDYLGQSCAQIEVFEARVPYMYLDSAGNVTVGVGLMLSTLEAALALPFMLNGQRAQQSDVAYSWNRLQGMRAGFRASAYNWDDAVTLLDADIDAQLRTFVEHLDRSLPSVYMTYPSWPTPAKLAILDMAYNLGIPGLAHGYPHMNTELRATPPNFALAAQECARNVNQPAFSGRNAWTAKMFLEASS